MMQRREKSAQTNGFRASLPSAGQSPNSPKSGVAPLRKERAVAVERCSAVRSRGNSDALEVQTLWRRGVASEMVAGTCLASDGKGGINITRVQTAELQRSPRIPNRRQQPSGCHENNFLPLNSHPAQAAATSRHMTETNMAAAAVTGS